MEIKVILPIDISLNHQPYLLSQWKGLQLFIPSLLLPKYPGEQQIPFESLLTLVVFQIPTDNSDVITEVLGSEKTVKCPETGWKKEAGSIDYRLLPLEEWALNIKFSELEIGDIVRINSPVSPDFIEGSVQEKLLRKVIIRTEADTVDISRIWWDSSKSEPKVRFISDKDILDLVTYSTSLALF